MSRQNHISGSNRESYLLSNNERKADEFAGRTTE